MRTTADAVHATKTKRFIANLWELPEGMPADLTADALAALIETMEATVVETHLFKNRFAAAMELEKADDAKMNLFLKRVRYAAKSVRGDDILDYERIGSARVFDWMRSR